MKVLGAAKVAWAARRDRLACADGEPAAAQRRFSPRSCDLCVDKSDSRMVVGFRN
jgi:hypothetical protein